jgi:4-hydroxy-tetrahydrodipicolinate synthase
VFDGSGGILLVDAYRRGVRGCMPGMELLDGIAALWQALQQGDDDAIYRLYFPICAIAALQMQAGLDGFLAIEKHILVKRGVFTSARRRKPYAWQLDDETAAELDRLLIRYDTALGRKEEVRLLDC